MTRLSSLVSFFSLFSILMMSAPSTSHAATYYVSTTGHDTDSGTTITKAWRTIAYAADTAVAGDTVYIQGGNYGNEQVYCYNSGTRTKPIVFEGRNGTPVLDFGTRSSTSNYGWTIAGASYIKIKNIELTQYYNCMYVNYSSSITLENVYAHDCGYTKWRGYGILLNYSKYCTIKNCTVTNCGGVNYQLSCSDYNTIDGCQTLGTLPSDDPNDFPTDYYFIVCWSSHNTIKNCYAEDKTRTGKGNHGFGMKDTIGSGGSHGHSTDNHFINCKAYGFEEALVCAHGAYGNTFTDCIGDSSRKNYYFSNGIMVRDGAHDNLFINCRAVGGGDGTGGEALCLYYSAEGAAVKTQYNNKFILCTFEARDMNSTTSGPLCVFFRNAQNNVFENCSFVNGYRFIRFCKDFDGIDKNFGNTFKSCTIYSMNTFHDTRTLGYPWAASGTAEGYDDTADLIFSWCNFFKNGFTKPANTNNLSYPPRFVDPATGDWHLKKAAADRTYWSMQ